MSTPIPAPFIAAISGPIPIPPASTSNTLIAPNRQRTLQPKPAVPLVPQSSAPNSSLSHSAFCINHLPAPTREQVIIFGPQMAHPSARKAKRKLSPTDATAIERETKKMRISRTKIYAPGCYNYELPANPSKGNEPQESNKHRCIRCKLDKKQVCFFCLFLRRRSS
jgi:hypothetical protein